MTGTAADHPGPLDPGAILGDVIEAYLDPFDPLDRLRRASELAAALATLGERVVARSVSIARRAGLPWDVTVAAVGGEPPADEVPRLFGLPWASKGEAVLAMALTRSQSQARRTVELDDLVAALLALPEGTASIVANSYRADIAAVGRASGQDPERWIDAAPVGPTADQLSPAVAALLRLAGSVAAELGHPEVGTEHLLLAALRSDLPPDVAAHLPAELDAPAALREISELFAAMGIGPTPGEPH